MLGEFESIALIAAIIFVIIAIALLIVAFMIPHVYKKYKPYIIREINKQLSGTLESSSNILNTDNSLKGLKLLVGKRKFNKAVQKGLDRATNEVIEVLDKFIKHTIFKIVLLVMINVGLALLSLGINASLNQLNNSMKTTAEVVLNMMQKEEEEAEEEETESWQWDELPDEELLEFGGSSNTSNEYDSTVDVTKYGFTADSVTIDASSRLQRSYNIAYISDLHMLQSTEPSINQKWFTDHGFTFESRRQSFNNSENILPDLIECLKNEPFDAIIFGGDIMDNYSEANFQYLKTYFDELNSSKTMYIMADHDYLTELTTNTGQNTAAESLGIQGYIKQLNIGKDGDNLVLIGQNNSTNQITSDGEQSVKSALTSNQNTLFFSHVPIESMTQAASMQEFSKNVHNNQVYYWSYASQNYNPGVEQQSLMSDLYNASSLLGCFFGHVHSSWDGELNTGIKEHIFAPAYSKSIGVIRIEGANKNASSENTQTGGNATGNATGDCVVALDDGNYYFFHQSKDCNNCKYCGNWSKSEWGTGNDYNLLADDGCAVYAMAMAVSNLTNRQVNPLEILESAGCTLTLKNDGTYRVDTGATPAFNCRQVSYKDFVEIIAEKYRLEFKQISGQSQIDSALSNGAYIWGIFDKPKTSWASSGTKTHFMVIRKKQNDLYYCFTSCRGKCTSTTGVDGAVITMNHGVSASESVNAFLSGRPIFYLKAMDLPPLYRGDGSLAPGRVTQNPSPPGFTKISDTEIEQDIQNGLYTREDYNYLVALSGESSSYEGFYAVACCVRNRIAKGGGTYKAHATATNQFTGFNEDRVGVPINEEVKCAAVQVLRGSPSTIENFTQFRGRTSGISMWAEAEAPMFINIGNNIHFETSGQVHTSVANIASDGIIIYDSKTKKWKLESGTRYTKN